MSNPFKVGDKVVRLFTRHGAFRVGQIGEVSGLSAGNARVLLSGDFDGWAHDPKNLRAAIAGQDYDVPWAQTVTPKSHTGGANMGHLPDGSSVQKHSAGPLYPCVIAMRDGKLGGKYDYGVISPRNQEPLWHSTHEAAVTLTEIIKKDLT